MMTGGTIASPIRLVLTSSQDPFWHCVYRTFRVPQYSSIVDRARPTNVHIHEVVLGTHKFLKNSKMPYFWGVEVIHMLSEGAMIGIAFINDASTLGKSPTCLKSIHNFIQPISLWHTQVHRFQNSPNDLASIEDTWAHSRCSNTKQVAKAPILDVGS